MGCTASTLDHEQQQEWIRSKLVMSDDGGSSETFTKLPEQSLQRIHRLPDDCSNKSCEDEELLINDYVSTWNESEYAIHDGSSLDDASKAENSMMESTTTRMGHSKSIATEDALYESSSSDSENHGLKLYITVDRSPYSVDGDDFDVESNEDTLITSSTVPKPIQFIESDNESAMDQISSGNTLVSNSIAPDIIRNDDLDEINFIANDTKINRGKNDIVFCPLQDELSNRENFEWKQDAIGKSKSLHNPVVSPVKQSSITVGMGCTTPAKLNLHKWVSETNRQKSQDRNKLNSPKRLDISKWERDLSLNDRTMSDVSKPTNNKSNSATLQQSSPNKTILMDEIARLKQQIKKVEYEASLATTKSIAYVKPSELVITPDNSLDFATSKALVQHCSRDDCLRKSNCSSEKESNVSDDSNQKSSTKTLRESESHVYDLTSGQSDQAATMVDYADGKCMKDACTNIRIDDKTANQLFNKTIKPLHTYGSKESLNSHSNEKIDDVDVSSKCKDSSKSPIYECVSVDEDIPECTSDVELTNTTNKSIHGKNGNELINSSASARSKVVEPRIEKQSQGYNRQESFDSVMMQYSVSTTDADPHFDQTCDESTLLYGDFESTNMHQKENCQIDDNTVDMNVSKTPSIDQAVVTQDYDEVTIESLDTEDVSGSESSREIFLTTMETTMQLHQTNYNSQDCVKQNNSKSTFGKEKPKQKRCSNDVPIGSPMSNDESNQLSLASSKSSHVGASNVMNDTALRITDASLNPADIPEQFFDATTFVKHLNLDPWNKDIKLDEQQIFTMIESNPALCSQKYSFEGFHGNVYPLSAMCALGASVPMIKKCYLAFPDAIKKADAWVGTSLHYACSYHASFQVVEYLAKRHPSALKAANQFNRFPLHMACMFDAEPMVISYLIRKFPGGCKKPDKLGMLPLHIACDSDIGINSPNVCVINLLTGSFPEGCMKTTENGFTPIAIAIARKASFSVIKTLVEACPESLSKTDHSNRLPLHLAVALKASVETIGLLVVSYPSGLVMEDINNETPYDCAVRLKLELCVLELLAHPAT